MVWFARSAIPVWHATGHHKAYDEMSEQIFSEVLNLPGNGPVGQRDAFGSNRSLASLYREPRLLNRETFMRCDFCCDDDIDYTRMRDGGFGANQ